MSNHVYVVRIALPNTPEIVVPVWADRSTTATAIVMKAAVSTQRATDRELIDFAKREVSFLGEAPAEPSAETS